jgi:3-dehydroquinate synthase
MVAAARIAVELGQAEPSLADRIEAILAGWGLPIRCPPFSVDEIWKVLNYDKKRRQGELRWVLPTAIGAVKITTAVPARVVKEILQQLGARS